MFYFAQKVDWFSYAMFLYHIMSGTVPFVNTTYLATISQVTTGTRPNFQHYNYCMKPQLPHMEGLMKACWRDNPDERPNGQEVLNVIQDICFTCLRRSVFLRSESTAVLYTNCDTYKEVLICTASFVMFVRSQLYIKLYREQCVKRRVFESSYTAHYLKT